MGEKPTEADEQGRMAAMNMQRSGGVAPPETAATSVKGSKSNTSERSGGPGNAGAEPAAATTVKGSKSNSDD